MGEEAMEPSLVAGVGLSPESGARMLRRAGVALLSALGLLLPAGATLAGTRTVEWCEKTYQQETGSRGADTDIPQLVQRLAAHEQECMGTGVYEARLALLLVFVGDYDRALRLARPFQKDPRSGPLARLAVIQAEHYRGLKTEEEARQLERLYVQFLKQYPKEVPEAWGMLGRIQFRLGNCEGAVDSLRRGLATTLDTGPIYRQLTICLVELRRTSEAVHAAEKAYEADQELKKYPNFACAAAVAFARAGQSDVARGVLAKLVKTLPTVVDTQAYRFALGELQAASSGQ